MRRREAPPYHKRITSLRVRFVHTPLQFAHQILTQCGDGGGFTGQPLKTGRQNGSILGGEPGTTAMSQPHFHASQQVQQDSQPLPDLIAGFAEPGIAHGGQEPLRLGESFARLCQDVRLLLAACAGQQQVHHARQFCPRQRFPPDHLENLGLVALRQPYHLPRGGGREQPHAQFLTRRASQAFDQGQPAAYPTLVAPQQFGHFHLTQAIFANQRLDNPGFFQLARSPPGAIQPVDGRLGRALVRLHQARGKVGEAGEGARRTQPFETVDQLIAIFTLTDHHRRQLSVAL